jgi:hypothetical protein
VLVSCSRSQEWMLIFSSTRGLSSSREKKDEAFTQTEGVTLCLSWYIRKG